MIYAYANIPLENSDPRAPVSHLRDWFTWDCYMFAVIGALTTWIGDILVVSLHGLVKNLKPVRH